MAEGPICRQCGGPVLASQANASTQTDAPEFTRSRFIIGLQEELIRTQKLLQQALQHREQSQWMATGEAQATAPAYALTTTPAFCPPMVRSPASTLVPARVSAAAMGLAPSHDSEPVPQPPSMNPHQQKDMRLQPEDWVVSQQPQPQLLAPLSWPLAGKHYLAEGSSSSVEDNGKEVDNPLEQELVITGDTVSTEKVGSPRPRKSRLLHKCDICGCTFPYLQGLRRHMLLHSGAKPHQCGQCGLQFARSGYLRTHERQVHQQQRPHHCPQCPKAFFDRHDVQIHMRSHTGERPYACEHCNKKFTLQRTLKTHEQTVHQLQRPYLCTKCGKCFASNRGLQTHQNTHTGERPFPCPECERSFRSPQCLRIHTQSHSTDRPYSCKACGRSFKTSVCLNGHRKTHTGERHFFCEVCGKAFARKESLKQHHRLHTGELPFPCMDCDRAFNRSSRLAEHCRLRHSQPSQRSAAEPGPSN